MAQQSGPKLSDFSKVALDAVKRIKNQLALFAVVETVLLIFLILRVPEESGRRVTLVYLMMALVAFLALLCFGVELRTLSIGPLPRSKTPTQSDVNPPPDGNGGERAVDSGHRDAGGTSPRATLFEESNRNSFKEHAQNLMLKARRVILMGTGLNILDNPSFRDRLLRYAAGSNCDLEIYMADPRSPSVETRLAGVAQGSF